MNAYWSNSKLGSESIQRLQKENHIMFIQSMVGWGGLYDGYGGD